MSTPSTPGNNPVTTRTVAEFIAAMKSPDDTIRGPAWQTASSYGSAAVQPLAGLLGDPNFEVARAAKRALYLIVRHSDRPGANQETQSVETALLNALHQPGSVAQREILWMLSEIGTDRSLPSMAVLLRTPEVREDARCAITRLPGKRATAALRAAFKAAPKDFKYALADSLRQRGEKVEGYPSQTSVPTRPTKVEPASGK